MKIKSPAAAPPMRWRVGELAKLTGLTVRTLHHYEEIGLLAASARTESGHRVYDEACVQRLYRVRALRSLGVPLPEIQRFVDDDATGAAILQQHLSRLERQVEQLTELRDRLRRICRQPGAPVAADELLATLELMSRLQRHVDKRQRQPSARAARNAEPWRALGEQLRACMDAGEDPATGRVREIARQARARIHDFAGGDPAVLEALAHLRTVDPPAHLAGWTPELMRYLDDALRALGAKEDKSDAE